MEHPAVVETAVVSSPDPVRGEVTVGAAAWGCKGGRWGCADFGNKGTVHGS